MSTTSVSPLRQRMIEDMSLRNLAPRTQQAYIRGCKKLAAFLRRSPDTARRPRTSGSFSCISPSTHRAGQGPQGSLCDAAASSARYAAAAD